MPNFAIRLQEIDDTELEEFIELWIERKSQQYVRVERIGAANDKGRDVIGFSSERSHEGPWDLYQCKRKTRGGKLGVPEAVPERKGELLVRRRLVEASLQLMHRCHLVEQDSVEDGLVWRAADDAASYVELLETPYSTHLKACAAWLGQEVRARSKAGFKAFVRQELGDWSEAFSTYGHGAAERS